jgi:hypothetical protein
MAWHRSLIIDCMLLFLKHRIWWWFEVWYIHWVLEPWKPSQESDELASVLRFVCHHYQNGSGVHLSPIQWVSGAFSWEVNPAKTAAVHSPSSRSEVKTQSFISAWSKLRAEKFFPFYHLNQVLRNAKCEVFMVKIQVVVLW